MSTKAFVHKIAVPPPPPGKASLVNLVGSRFAHQLFADSRESIRKKRPKFLALGQIRANRVFSPIRIAIRIQSLLLPLFLEGRFAKETFFFFFEVRIDH